MTQSICEYGSDHVTPRQIHNLIWQRKHNLNMWVMAHK